jgi:4-coumarate--CoA ligase
MSPTYDFKGTPKELLLILAQVYQCQAHDPAHWSSTHSSLVFSPMVHIANTTLPLFLGPWVGLKHVILVKFDIDTFCKMVEQHRPRDMMLARPVLPGLLTGELQKKYDFSAVKYLVSTGGRRKEVTDRLLAAGDWSFIDLYGMTEAAPYIAWSRIGDNVRLDHDANQGLLICVSGTSWRDWLVFAKRRSSTM